jgi:lipid-A-disaccharide synthase
MHAANLVKAIRLIDPSISFSGIGGERLNKAGVEIYDDLSKIAVVGFVEVIKHYGEIKKVFFRILRKIFDRQIS